MAFEYTVKRCAEELNISETRVHQLIKEGALPAELIAGRYFVDEDAVKARVLSKPSPGRPPKRIKEDPRSFMLMNREYEVFEFIYDDHNDEFTEVTSVIDPARAPLGFISPRGRKVSLSALTYWWKHRSIPRSRVGLEAKLAELGIADPSRLPFKSFGLSLSDQYWIKPAGLDIDWESINFFMNPFIEFESSDWFASIGLESPDNTSEGQLSKRWIHKNRVPYLLKGGMQLGQEPYNEVVATRLYRRLLDPDEYVSYQIDHLPSGEVISVCQDFLTDKEEYIPAFYVIKAKNKAGNHSLYQHYLECCTKLNVQGAEEALAKMIVTDDILANTDRHLRNFGLIRNVETLEYRVAPLFDTGNCLLSSKPESVLVTGDLSFKTKPFSEDPNQQLRLVNDYSWLDMSALEGFAEEASEILAANQALEMRLPYIKKLIEQRVERLKIIAS